VADIVTGIRERTSDTAASMTAMIAHVESGTELTRGASDVLGEILTAMRAMGETVPVMRTSLDQACDIITQEVAATEEMSALTKDITAAVSAVAEIAETNTDLAQGATAATEELTATVQGLYAEDLATVSAALSDDDTDPTDNN
jgi:methyl-accepting chemotaxis protein